MGGPYMTGQQILDDYGHIIFIRDLVTAVMERKELHPIHPVKGLPIIEGSNSSCEYARSVSATEVEDRCFFCREPHWFEGDDVYEAATFSFCQDVKSQFDLCARWRDGELIVRLKSVVFSRDEVTAYAGKYWLAASGQDQQSKKGSSRPLEILPTIPGTAWDQIKIRIAKNDRIEIERPSFDMVFHNAKDLGLDKAKIMLFILKSFGFYDGELKRDIIKEVNAANISNLRKHLKRIFPHIEDDPIICKESSTYVCQFQISTNKEEFSEDHYTSDEVQDDGEDWEELMGAKN